MEFLSLSTNRVLTKNEISITGDTLTIEIHDDTQADGIGTTKAKDTFSLSDLIQKYSQDHGCIALFPQGMNDDSTFLAVETTQLSLPDKTKPNEGYISQTTTEGKQFSGSPYSVVNGRYASYAYLYILTPSINCSVDEITIVYRANNPDVELNGVQQTGAQEIISMKNYLDTWLPISIDGAPTMTAGQSQEYTVTAPENTTVYLSADIGMLNRARVKNGSVFKLNTDGLEAGEVVTIKAGYKFWDGVSRKEITLE
jgi:hypothetical protein